MIESREPTIPVPQIEVFKFYYDSVETINKFLLAHPKAKLLFVNESVMIYQYESVVSYK